MSSEQGNIVKLDIGGTVFKTLRSTLTKFDGFFKTMLETDIPITKNESGAIFIDRDPKYFLQILNFMRDGRVKLPESRKDVEELCVEAEYYLLTGLVEFCNANITTDVVKLNVGGTVFQTTKTTLTKKYSLLEKLIDNESQDEKLQKARDDSGCIFIDRDPKHFRFILNFLSDADVAIPKSGELRQEIKKEAQYYWLSGLAEQCNVTTASADDRSNIRIIESDSQMLQIIADMGDKPILIVFYFIDNNGQLYHPPRFNIKRFVSRHGYSFDIYFKTFNQKTESENKYTQNSYRIYNRLSKQTIYGSLDSVESGITSYNLLESRNRSKRGDYY